MNWLLAWVHVCVCMFVCLFVDSMLIVFEWFGHETYHRRNNTNDVGSPQRFYNDNNGGYDVEY